MIRAFCFQLQITFHGATDVGALGLDQRLGWLAISILVPTVMTVPMHMINYRWIIMPNTSRGLLKVGVVVVVIAVLMQDVLGVVTNRPSAFGLILKTFSTSTLRPHISPFAAVTAFANVSLGGHFIKWRKAIPIVALLAVIWILLVSISQIVWDASVAGCHCWKMSTVELSLGI